MKILITPDKFKSSLSAFQVAKALEIGINDINKNEVEICPLADGGNGSLEILNHFLEFEKTSLQAIDALGRSISTYYYTKGDSAYIELALTSGLSLIDEKDRDILNSSTLGTGIVIQHAIDSGSKEINLFVGGSATNDAGMGILHALGVKFYDKMGDLLLPSGRNMGFIYRIDRKVLIYKLIPIEFNIFVDVDHPFLGTKGAAKIFAAQKGASSFDIERLELGLMNFAANVSLECFVNIEKEKGSGAAGGVAGGLFGVLGAKIMNGFDYISGIVDLESKIKNSDIIISGEGQLDGSSLNGKVVSGVAKLAIKYNKPLILVVGNNELSSENLDLLQVKKVYSILERAKNINDSFYSVEKYLHEIGHEICIDVEK